MGELKYLNAIGAPYKAMKFIPTGGIDESMLLAYLKSPRVHACGGSWMVKSDLIAAGKFDEIQDLSAKAVATMLGLHVAHVGINSGSAEEAARLAGLIGGILKVAPRETSAAFFAGTQVEFRKAASPGVHGHLALGTHFIERAIAYFERSGFRILPETMLEKNGKPHAVYVDMEVAGFAVHLPGMILPANAHRFFFSGEVTMQHKTKLWLVLGVALLQIGEMSPAALKVTVTNTSAIARRSETVELQWQSVAGKMSGLTPANRRSLGQK